jgi:phage terminase large subunit-like protein
VLSDRSLPAWVGVDASVKRDTTAIVAVTFDNKAKKVRLLVHKIFQPTPGRPLDFEATIEPTVRDFCRRFSVRTVAYDPYQMAAVAQRLSASGIPMREYPQSVPNLTAIGANLYELIKSGGLVVYPDDALRLAVSRTIALETPRGLRLAKEKTSHKIDVVVALAMAALHAVEQGSFEVPLVAPIWIPKVSGDYYGMPLSFAATHAPHLDRDKANWPTY